MRIAAKLPPLIGLALAACADRPTTDQIAESSMIGLPAREVLACLGQPYGRAPVAQATEIWSYPAGYTATDTPPWAAGLDFALSAKPVPCNVRVTMTNAHVSAVAYALPDGRALPPGRQCVFAVRSCARERP